MYIIHVVNKEEYEKEIRTGFYGRRSVERCGFIHCSDEIRWEDGGGLDFPHIYGLLNKEAVIAVFPHLWSADRIWIPNEELKPYAVNGFEREYRGE